MAGPDGIPDARQKICYRVGQTHSFSFIPRSSAAAETSGNVRGLHPKFSVVSFQFSAPADRRRQFQHEEPEN
jgi:hypothetical protein